MIDLRQGKCCRPVTRPPPPLPPPPLLKSNVIPSSSSSHRRALLARPPHFLYIFYEVSVYVLNKVAYALSSISLWRIAYLVKARLDFFFCFLSDRVHYAPCSGGTTLCTSRIMDGISKCRPLTPLPSHLSHMISVHSVPPPTCRVISQMRANISDYSQASTFIDRMASCLKLLAIEYRGGSDDPQKSLRQSGTKVILFMSTISSSQIDDKLQSIYAKL